MKKSKKSLGATAIVFALSLVMLGGCAASSGIAHLGDGKVAVSLNSAILGNVTPILYDCSSGSTCVRIGQ